MNLMQYCQAFDTAVRKLTHRDVPATSFPFTLDLAKFHKMNWPAAAVATLACNKAGFIYSGVQQP